jgi:tRNA pseudouridine55 synthase
MHTFEALEAAANGGLEALDRLLLPADSALPAWPSTHLTAVEAARLAQGQAVGVDPALPRGNVKVYGPSDQLIAIGVVTDDSRLAPTRVFIR